MLGQRIAEEAHGFVLPPAASTLAAGHDALFDFILGTSAVFFTGIVVALGYFVWRYRRRQEGERTSPLHGNLKLEILWSVVPLVLLIFIFAWGFRGYLDLTIPPAEALDIRVTAQKWSWSFEYPRDGIRVPGELVVPVGRPVRLTMSSLDVIHSFYVPAFRIKKDVLPNRYTVAWFEATVAGEYDLLCAEYCGTAHSQMLGRIRVLPEADYDAWIASGGGMSGEGMSSEDYGRQLFGKLGCAVCHAVDGSRKTGPSLLGKVGTIQQFTDGTTARVDDNYLRESIVEPMSKVVVSYEPVMPTFAGRVDDRQLNALIDYLKSLGTAPKAGQGASDVDP